VRYYILCVSDYADVPSYILAEVMRDALDDGFDREMTLASGLAGERAMILTRAELNASHEGTEALEAWSVKNDSSFNRENRRINAETDPRPRHLYVVGSTPPVVVGSTPRSRAAADAERFRHSNIRTQKKTKAIARKKVRKEHTGGRG
jgi:hypothetical protein